MATETWARALDEYRYPVDFTRFTGAGAHPSWFDLDTEPGNRLKTMEFEARFREQARHRLEVWGEVAFWKLYTMPLVRNGTTQQVLDVRVRPNELWSACMDYIEEESRNSFSTFRSKLFSAPVVATAATFPAFICPERFPMVDTQITRWALKNGHCHCYSGINGPDLEQGSRVAVREGPQGEPLAVHRILDRLVSLHRAGAVSAHRLRVAHPGCRDGGLHSAEI